MGPTWGVGRRGVGGGRGVRPPGAVPVLRPLLVFVLFGFLGLAVRGAVQPVWLGQVRQQGEAEVCGGGWGGGVHLSAVLAAVAQVVADIGQRVVDTRGRGGTRAGGVRGSWWPRGGQQGLTAVGRTQLPVEGGL
jgi:hypothetical protein